jgi:hypothetical protein
MKRAALIVLLVALAVVVSYVGTKHGGVGTFGFSSGS